MCVNNNPIYYLINNVMVITDPSLLTKPTLVMIMIFDPNPPSLFYSHIYHFNHKYLNTFTLDLISSIGGVVSIHFLCGRINTR